MWVRTDWSIPDCRLNPPAPLPAWLHTALAGADLSRPEGGWPNFARCQSPVDWPALIQEHPEWLLPDQDSLDANAGPRWPGIADAYQLLAERGHRPYLDVALWVTEDARISVDPIGLLVEHPPSVPSATVTDVDDLLVAAGRLRQDLHYPNEPTGLCWTLNC